MGYVTLNLKAASAVAQSEQEEVYFIVEGIGEMCLGQERQILKSGQAVFIQRVSTN